MSEPMLDRLYLEHLQTLMQGAERALATAAFDAMVIHSGDPLTQFLDDQDYAFKVNPHFKAWIPILDNPGCVLVYRPGSKPRLFFRCAEDFWHQPANIPEQGWIDAIDIVEMYDMKEAATHWATLGRVAVIGPPGCLAAAETHIINPKELLCLLHSDRAVKTRYELECMRRANALGALGHRAAQAAFRDGLSEYETHMRYLTACAQREEEMPYNNIVAHNDHAAILHYQHLDRGRVAPLRSMLIDAGAQFRGYASDITRTYAASAGRFSELITAVDQAQLRLCDEIVSGKDYRDVHLSAHRALGDVMHDVGLTNVSGEVAMERGVTGVFFPHGIGHLLGLQVHDVGGVIGDVPGSHREGTHDHPYLRLTRKLEPGVVVTVEPGVYFIDSLLAAAHQGAKRPLINWKVVEELRPFGGVRIEDDVATTLAAPENMTRNAFSKLAA